MAVVGGAMGATSAFDEGGDHLAVRAGKVTGRLAARGQLGAYNREWQRATGEEVRRNVALADMVLEWGPADWDRAFRITDRLHRDGEYRTRQVRTAGGGGLKLLDGYEWAKFRNRGGRYCQIREEEYDFDGTNP